MFDPKKIVSIIAVYNDQYRLARAIESAARSIVPDGLRHEVIVVDDVSTDDTLNVANRVASDFANVRVLQMKQNGGPSSARNFALSSTDAAWFLPIDSDDFVEQSRLSTLFRVAAETGATIVADNLLITDDRNAEHVHRVLWPGKPDGQIELSAELFITHCYNADIPRSELGFLKPLIDRRLIQDAEMPYQDGVRFGEDYELYCRLLLDGAVAVLVDPLGYYAVQRPSSASHSQGADEHRRLVTVNQNFLKRSGLNPEVRSALKGFLAFSRREWAMWSAIGAVRSRNVLRFLSAFTISVDASIYVMRRAMASTVKKLVSD